MGKEAANKANCVPFLQCSLFLTKVKSYLTQSDGKCDWQTLCTFQSFLLTDSLLPRRVVEVITGGQGTAQAPKLMENLEKIVLLL